MHPIATNICRPAKSRSEPYDRYTLLLGLVVMCAPLWWVLGLSLLVYHLAAVLVFIAFVLETSYDNRRLSVPLVAGLFLAVSLIYGLSISINAPAHDAMRTVAAVNNWSYWLIAAMLIIVLSARFRLVHIPGLLRISVVLSAFNVLIAIVFLAIAASGVHSLSIPTPLSRLVDVLGRTPLVEYSVNMRLITEDWFSDTTTPRFNPYAPYPTAAGALFMITLPMLWTWAAQTRRLNSPLFWLLLLGNVVGLGMTLARMAVIALMASVAVVYVLQKRNPLMWGLACLVVVVLVGSFLQQVAGAVIAAREGSSQSRFALYQASIGQLDGITWFLGLGIRTYSLKFQMPIGSHSTYVSLLYRSGLCGLATFLLLQGVLLLQWYRLKEIASAHRDHVLMWRAFGVVFVSMALWMLTEDVDSPQLLAFTYFSMIGAFLGFRRQLVSSSVPQDSPGATGLRALAFTPSGVRRYANPRGSGDWA